MRRARRRGRHVALAEERLTQEERQIRRFQQGVNIEEQFAVVHGWEEEAKTEEEQEYEAMDIDEI